MTIARPRAAVLCVLAAAGLGGILFAPVFSAASLAGPIAAVVLLVFLADEACRQWPSLASARPLLTLLAGLLGVIWTVLGGSTVAGLPSADTVRLLADGVTQSWQLTLQSTWPARPEPQLLLFVPQAVLLACVAGVELLHRVRPPLVALLPSLAVVALSQAYSALTGFGAVVAAVGYGALAAVLLMVTRGSAGPRRLLLAGLAVPAVVLGVVGALLLSVASPLGRVPFTLRTDGSAPLAQRYVANPLDDIAGRLNDPLAEVFRYTSDASVDRWTLAVLDRFDGVNWTSDWDFRRLGTSLRPPREVTAPASARSARVLLSERSGPWLPSQRLPADVEGANPLVDEARGTLAGPAPVSGYRLSWWEPRVDADALADAAVDQRAAGNLGSLGRVPAGLSALAEKATGGMRPHFRSALVLERYLQRNYRVATGANLPTGHSWPQLRRFLLGEDRRGTSEQFAAAYVVLARLRGIPARLAVGFRSPAKPDSAGEYVVRNGDVLAWPEVAVAGVGWVPLDPMGQSTAGGGPMPTGLAQVTAQARANLPEPQQLTDPKVAEPKAAGEQTSGDGWPWYAVLAVAVGTPLAVILLLWLAVPVVRWVRAVRRRRAVPARSVVGAWAEARDRLRAHGVPVSVGMTVRDLTPAAGRIAGPATVDGLHALARSVDLALWSGSAVTEQMAADAWASVRAVRRGLSSRPLGSRLRAALDPRSLLPPR